MQVTETNVRRYGTALTTLLALVSGVAGAAAADRSGNYLVVTPTGYDGSAPLTQFIDARTGMGFNVMTYVVPSGTSKEAIRAYIRGLWGTPDAPDYILIVGDAASSSTATANTIPYWVGQASRHACSDVYYACMDDGDDWQPEIAIGRFSVTTPTMLQNVVDKTLFVEAGDFPDPDYGILLFKNISFTFEFLYPEASYEKWRQDLAMITGTMKFIPQNMDGFGR